MDEEMLPLGTRRGGATPVSYPPITRDNRVRDRRGEEIVKTLLTTDGSEASRHAAETWLRHFWKEGPAIVVSAYPNPAAGFVGAIGPPVFDIVAFETQLAREAAGHVGRVAEVLESGGLDVSRVVEMGDPATAILELARRESVDLVVVGSHGRSGFERFLLGSVSGRVVEHAPCDVLVVKSPEARR